MDTIQPSNTMPSADEVPPPVYQHFGQSDEDYKMDHNSIERIDGTREADSVDTVPRALLNVTRFLESCAHPVTVREDQSYNVSDQLGKKKWRLDPANEGRFFTMVEELFRGGHTHGFSTRQNGMARVFHDYDIVLQTPERISNDTNIIKALVRGSVAVMLRDTTPPSAAAQAGETKMVFTVLATGRTALTYSQEKGGHKDGIHIYMDVMLPLAYRAHKAGELAAIEASHEGFIADAFQDVAGNMVEKKEGVFDKNCPNVLPLLIGGIKPGGTPYELIQVYTVTYDCATRSVGTVQTVKPAIYATWNMVAKFSPTHGSAQSLVPVIAPSLERQLAGQQQQVEAMMDDGEVEDMSIARMNDPNAREVSELIKMLAPIRSTAFEEWFKILVAIAKFGDKFKPIARAFSLNSSGKYSQSSFEENWKRALAITNGPTASGLCIFWLRKLAQRDDPAAYKEFQKGNLMTLIMRSISEASSFMDGKTAHLGDYPIASIILSAFPGKYIATPRRNQSGRRLTDDSDVTYYTLITPGTPEYKPGMAYKYAEIMTTAPLQIYISSKMPAVLNGVKEFYRKKRQQPGQSPEEMLRCSIALGIIGKAYASCQSHFNKQSILRQFAYLNMNQSFEDDIDTSPFVMGVWDALLEATIEPRLIRGPSEYKVTRTSRAEYIAFDPTNPILIRVAQWYIDFAPLHKFDKFLYLIMYICQVLNNDSKQLKLLNIHGWGSNGKSTIIETLCSSLGSVVDKASRGYGYQISMDYLTNPRVNSSSPQPELMPLEYARLCMMSEPGANQRLVEQKLKLLFNGESLPCRGLYGEECNLKIKSVFMCSSNRPLRLYDGDGKTRVYSFDYGSIRRLDYMKAEMTFTGTPDASNPLHRKADPSIQLHQIHQKDNHGALLSILSIVHALFIMMHDSQMLYVCSPNVRKETETEIAKIDTIGRFVNESCVRSPGVEVPLDTFIDKYMTWHDDMFTAVHHSRDLIRAAFTQSKLEKYIKERDGIDWVVGCKALTKGESHGPNDSRFQEHDEFDFKDYREYKMPDGHKLPFDGKITPTASAANFLLQLDALYKEQLASFKERQAKALVTGDRTVNLSV